MEVRVVRRGEYDDEVVRWADAIVSAGGKLRPSGPGDQSELSVAAAPEIKFNYSLYVTLVLLS